MRRKRRGTMRKYRVAVIGIIEHQGLVLIGKKIKTSHFLSGGWHIPGGKIQKGEDEEQALIREINEETGVSIRVNKFLSEGIVPQAKILGKWYLCAPLNNNLHAGDDLSQVKYVSKQDVLKLCDPRAVSLWPKSVVEYFKKAS